MRVIHAKTHRLHAPEGELSGGWLVPPFETPSRVARILDRLRERGMSEIVAPDPFDEALLVTIHDPDYLGFLATAWEAWKAAGMAGDVIAANIPARGMHVDRVPRGIDGRVGYYAHAAETAITRGTWEAALGSASCARTAQREVSAGARSVFALCRPPGHHATRDQYGGYCFLNNAALAAQGLRRDGAARVAVLDIDFHHGNGTQAIFYEREDVFVASLHGAPEEAYPFFIGYADERGRGAGEGANLNLPMPRGTGFDRWSEALDHAAGAIRVHGAEALVVSLGVDAYHEDPISFFGLSSDDFLEAGRRIGRMGLPTVFCLEGGYALEAVGRNVVNVLEGFEGA